MSTARTSIVVDLLYALLAVMAGLCAGWIDFNCDRVQSVAGMIVLYAGLLGYARPNRAWLWAVIVSLGIPVAYLFGPHFGFMPHHWPSPNLFVTFIGFVPAIVGAYSGVFIRELKPFLSSL